MTDDGLRGRVALITGAARGLGAAYARALHAHGAHVVITDVQHEAGAALAGGLGERAEYQPLDVTDEEAWADVVARIQDRRGAVDVLINNAGIANAAPIEHMTMAKWNAAIAVNLTGTFLGCRAVVPGMKAAGGGSIVNISSVEGMRGSVGLHAYTAAKFGVRGLSKSLAVELGPAGIRVNSVHPGLILTDMTTRIDPARLDIPLGRPGTPDDVTGIIVFLASDASRFISGDEFIVDGGMIAGIPHR